MPLSEPRHNNETPTGSCLSSLKKSIYGSCRQVSWIFRAGSKSRDFALVNKTIFSKSENFRSV